MSAAEQEGQKGIEGTYEYSPRKGPKCTLDFTLMEGPDAAWLNLSVAPKDGASFPLDLDIEKLSMEIRDRVFRGGPNGKILVTDLETGDPMTRIMVENLISPNGEKTPAVFRPRSSILITGDTRKNVGI